MWESCWCHLRKSWCHQQSSIFWFLGLLSVHLESLVIISEMSGDLGCNNIQKYGEQAVCKTTYMTRVKGSERRPIIFIFRLNIILHDSYQVYRWNCHGNRGMEVQKVPGNYVKSFSRFLLSLLETSVVSLRNCIIWILSLITVN